ncbi:cell division protein SepF [Nocardioides sp. TRM66260-LWL]|uniref:cell division protein SepF n=1 Tax=Nocardioides sp. TRM66260-LWL TaxID=2874478 RepID=UPI001CC6638F|nr:cell division protein SepF [Nocardioides sp. TRM66260-LWL]MBZ5733354.1 cell division protein SepF [Nocardioides sp. TRM66260-LWL]
MSGAMRRLGEYLGLVEDTGRYDEWDADGAHDLHETQAVPAARPAPAREARPVVADLAERRRPVSPVAPVSAPVLDLPRIVTVNPSTYNEARTIGEHFRDGIPVIMNLTEMSDADAKRLVDFAAGLVFATRGTIERVTAKVFLLSPANVTVTAEDRARIAEGDFFNQS